MDYLKVERFDENGKLEEYEIHKQDITSILSDRNTDKLTTMGNFWKKKNAKITA